MTASPSSPTAPGSPASARHGRWSLLALVVWSLYVWVTRIANATGDAALSAASKTFSVVLALTFVGFAAAGAVVLVRAWSRPLERVETLVLRAFAAWTVAVWVVRVPMILLDDRSVGFKAVHAVLGLISIALAALVWRSTTREPAAVVDSRPAASAS